MLVGCRNWWVRKVHDLCGKQCASTLPPGKDSWQSDETVNHKVMYY